MVFQELMKYMHDNAPHKFRMSYYHDHLLQHPHLHARVLFDHKHSKKKHSYTKQEDYPAIP